MAGPQLEQNGDNLKTKSLQTHTTLRHSQATLTAYPGSNWGTVFIHILLFNLFLIETIYPCPSNSGFLKNGL